LEVTGTLRVTDGLSNVSDLSVVQDDLTVSSNVAVSGGGLELTQVSNVAQIKSSSNVVTEFVRSKKLIKYPRVAMTANSSGGYVASASREFGAYYAYKAFNETNTDFWTPGEYYNGTDYAFNSSASSSSLGGVAGEWIKLQSSESFVLNEIKLRARSGSTPPHSQFFEDFTVLGSNDDSTWSIIKTVTGASDPSTGTGASGTKRYSLVLANSNAYEYIAIVVTRAYSLAVIGMAEIEFYGVPEYDPEAHGTDVIVRSVPNVPNTDWLEVYYDGQDYTSMPATITDKSGNVTGTPNGGVGFDTEYKAFTFDGTDDYVQGTLSNPAGAWLHSVSCWWKTSVDPGTSAYDTIFSLGDYTATEFTTLYIKSNFALVSIYGSGAYFSFSVTVNRWYHSTVVMRGTKGSISDIDFYLDGVKLTSTGQFGTAATRALPANASLRLGREVGSGTLYFNGSIANFRLFNRDLTSDEAWQLYAYQREYFGHGNLGMTLKSGRLGIGVSEPRAVLDVMGIPYGPGATPRFHVRRSDNYKATTAGGVVQFDYAEVDSHNGFNPSTYKYTVKVAGTYFLIGDVMLRQNGSSQIAGSRVEIRVNQGIQDSIYFASYGQGTYYSGSTVTVQGIAYLNVGDLVFMYHTGLAYGDIFISDLYQGFSGFLLC